MEAILRHLDRLTDCLAWLIEWALLLLVAVFSSLAFVQVILRYGFNYGLFWADEVTLLAFTWTIFLSAALALERKMHFGVYLVVDRLPRQLRLAVAVLVHLGMVGVVLFFLWFGIWNAWTNWIQVSDVLRVPKTWWYLTLPLGCLSMLVSLTRDLCLLFGGRELARVEEEVA